MSERPDAARDANCADGAQTRTNEADTELEDLAIPYGGSEVAREADRAEAVEQPAQDADASTAHDTADASPPHREQAISHGAEGSAGYAMSGKGATEQMVTQSEARPLDGAVRVSIVGLFTLAAIGAAKAAAVVLVPFVLSVLLFLTFRPIVRVGARRGVPPGIAAAVVVIGLIAVGGAVFYTLSGPVTNAANRAPEIATQIQERIENARGSLQGMVDEANDDGAANTIQRADIDADPETEVIVTTPETGGGGGASFVVTAAQAVAINVVAVLSTLLITLVLLFFLLASGSLFYEKLVQSFKRLEDKKQALFTVHQVERDISRYLLTITVINAGLGVAIGTAMWLLGMPNPVLWFVLPYVLNYVPYAGAILGTVTAFAVALLTFDTIGEAALVPIVYYILTTIEGSVVTPYFVGRRLQLNTVSVFVFVAFAFWVWGTWGALMAVPVLVVLKETCENVPGGEPIANFLSARSMAQPTETSGGVPNT